MFNFLKNEWKFFLILFIILAGLYIGYVEYKDYKNIQQINITGKSDTQIAKTIPVPVYYTPQQTDEVVKAIRQADVQPPTYTFNAKTFAELDKKANDYAKKTNADFVTKEEVKKDDGTIQGVYKGVHLEKNYRILAGMTYIKHEGIMGSIGYQDKQNLFILHATPHELKGATYMRTIIKW